MKGYLIVIGFILALLVILQIPTIIVYNTTPFQQLKVYYNSKENIYALETETWKVEEFSPFDIIRRGSFYEAYIMMANDCWWTNDYVRLKADGTIIKEDLTESMRIYGGYCG